MMNLGQRASGQGLTLKRPGNSPNGVHTNKGHGARLERGLAGIRAMKIFLGIFLMLAWGAVALGPLWPPRGGT